MKSKKRRTLLKYLLVSSAAILQSCWRPFRVKMDWTNAVYTAGVDPTIIRQPSTIHDLIKIVKEAESQNISVKMVGSGHSFSDVAMCDHILLKPQSLNNPIPINKDILKPKWANSKYLVQVEAGMRIREINELLDQQDLAFHNLGGYEIQTISGAFMTGTHGSGIHFGPIDTQIRSITVVVAEGKVLVVEPTDGITDQSKFNGTINLTGGDTVQGQLIQDDKYFNAMLVSMGSCGIVYSVVMEAKDSFWLDEVRTKTTWGELTQPGGFLQRLVNGEKIGLRQGDPTYYEIYFNPYNRKNNNPADHNCVLTERFIVDPKEDRTKDERKRGKSGNRLIKFVVRLTREGEDLVRYFNKKWKLLPKFIDDALNQIEDKTYKEKSYNVFNIGAPNHFRVYGIEMCFKLEDIVDAVEDCFRHANELKQRKWMHWSPPSIRFAAPSQACLSMTNNQESAFIEMGIFAGANGAKELMESYERLFIDKYKARPHWGLDMNILTDIEQVKKLYGSSCNDWLDIYHEMNATGVFNGRFTDRLGISL